jgi:integrase
MARKAVERNISYDEARGLYYVHLDSGKDETGRRMRAYRTYSTLSQARKALLAFQAQRAVYSEVTPRTTTLAQWLDYWMKEIVAPNRADTTAYSYGKIIENHLVPALGDIPIQHLTPQHIQTYYTMLQRDKALSPNTIRRHHDLLSSSLRMAVKQDVLIRSPTERVEPPRTIPYQPRFYSPENLKRLYAEVEGHWLELTVKLAGCLGLRREEICGLKWSCVDFQLRRIHIREARTAAGPSIVQKETKNRSSCRVLHLTDELYPLLRREQHRQQEERLRLGADWPDTGLVLVDQAGHPRSPNNVSLAFHRFVTRRGLPDITLHGLRHTFATVASAQGAPLFEIGKALGHSTPSTTGRIYTHLLDITHAPTLSRVASALK